jgi:hypothetical protein
MEVKEKMSTFLGFPERFKNTRDFLNHSKPLKCLMVLMLTLVVLMTTLPMGYEQAHAEGRIGQQKSSSSYQGSQGRLRQAVDDAVADKVYTSSTGDSIKGSQLVKNGVTTDRFQELTSKEKQRLINDMTTAVKKQQEKDKANNVNNPVTDDTVNNWLQDLQQHPGVGSRLLATITEQLKPDYVSGNRIFAPFAGPLNTFIALVIIVAMVLLVLTFAFDLAYINIPMFQSFVVNSMNSNGSGGSRSTNFFVGREAVRAVEESENDSNGKFKNPNAIYLKHRVVGIACLGLCLLYLIQGQIFTLVGMLMDLLGGFLS